MDKEEHYYVYKWIDNVYIYDRTCGTIEAASERVEALLERYPHAVFTINAIIAKAFY